MRWTSRKLWITGVSALIATALLMAGFITEGVWQTVFLGTIGVYIVSQAGVDGVGALKGGT